MSANYVVYELEQRFMSEDSAPCGYRYMLDRVSPSYYTKKQALNLLDELPEGQYVILEVFTVQK